MLHFFFYLFFFFSYVNEPLLGFRPLLFKILLSYLPRHTGKADVLQET